MTVLGTGAKCCGDPASCGVVGCELAPVEVEVDTPLPSLADIDEMNEEEDDE